MERTIANMTTLCYLERDDCYLMLHRVKKKNDINHDKWIGVGGHFEMGESPEECALREVREETGLTLTSMRLRGIVTFVAQNDMEYMFLFTSDSWIGEMIECTEGNLEWVPKSRIPQLPIWEGDQVFFRLLDQNEPFFSLKLVYEGDVLARTELNGIPFQPLSGEGV